jgi:hypothetical protein
MAKSDSKEDMKMDINQDKKLIKKAFSMHDKQLHENKKTNLTKLKGGGMVGGKTNEGMKQYGRNVAKMMANGVGKPRGG